jgi:hypothetical protein
MINRQWLWIDVGPGSSRRPVLAPAFPYVCSDRWRTLWPGRHNVRADEGVPEDEPRVASSREQSLLLRPPGARERARCRLSKNIGFGLVVATVSELPRETWVRTCKEPKTASRCQPVTARR